MMCDGCINALTKAIQKIDPNAQVIANLDSQQLQVETQQTADAVRTAIVQAGYDLN